MNANSTPLALAAHTADRDFSLTISPPPFEQGQLHPARPFKAKPTNNGVNRRNILVATRLANHDFLQGIARFAKENDWHLITDMLHTGVLPKRWDGDGILAFAPCQSEITSYATGRNTPCVTVSMTDECKSVPRIEPDHLEIGRLAAKHLIHSDCRKFIWAPFIDDPQNRERFSGFQSVLKTFGYNCETLSPPHQNLTHPWQDDWIGWKQSVVKALSGTSERVGLFAFNDCLSVEIATIAQEIGLNVPDDLAIIGAGNEQVECNSTSVPLSSVDLNLEEMAYQAATLLSDILNNRRREIESIRIAPKKVEARASTENSTKNRSRIQQAMTFIAENFSDPNLGVAPVSEALGISRRQLERDFRAGKGNTIREFIEEIRMRVASKLLLEQPDSNVEEVARRVGISSPGSFFRIFRKRFGLTPSEYRSRI